MESIFHYLEAGGNISSMALVFIMWRFDRRLLIIETRINGSESTG